MCHPSISSAVGSGWSPSETLESGSLGGRESAGDSDGTVLRVFVPWLIAQMCRFRFSLKRPPQSWALRISAHH
jgi:hypothetical protein